MFSKSKSDGMADGWSCGAMRWRWRRKSMTKVRILFLAFRFIAKDCKRLDVTYLSSV